MKEIGDGHSSQALALETADDHKRPRSQLDTKGRLAAPLPLPHLQNNSEEGRKSHSVSQNELQQLADMIAAIDAKVATRVDIADIKTRMDKTRAEIRIVFHDEGRHRWIHERIYTSPWRNFKQFERDDLAARGRSYASRHAPQPVPRGPDGTPTWYFAR